jgi:hypothetical protein
MRMAAHSCRTAIKSLAGERATVTVNWSATEEVSSEASATAERWLLLDPCHREPWSPEELDRFGNILQRAGVFFSKLTHFLVEPWDSNRMASDGKLHGCTHYIAIYTTPMTSLPNKKQTRRHILVLDLKNLSQCVYII